MEDIKRGAGYEYQPGFPELRLEVAGIIDQDGNPKIQVAGSIPHGSLVFKNNEGSLQAEITISYDIENFTTGQSKNIQSNRDYYQGSRKQCI